MESDKMPNPIFDYIPLAVLVLESVCGVLCNGAVLLLFCMRKSLLRTASDLFTINLSFVDFLFSGLVLPVVVITRLQKKSSCEQPVEKNPINLEVIRNCIVLFGTVVIALGTLLVSLDRGDVSLKPSKRFFNHSKAIIAIGLTWCISSLGVPIAILPSLLSLDGEKGENNTMSSYITTKWNNKTLMKYVDETERKCCNPHPCNGATINSCTIQIIFEIPIFVAAILTIIIIYGKILWSVQRRSKKYITGSIKSSNGTKKSSKSLWFDSHCGFCIFNSCCSQCQHTSENSSHSKATLTKINCPKSTSTKFDCNAKSKDTNIQKKIGNIRKAKKQDSLEDALFVEKTEKVDSNQNNSKPPEATNNEKKQSKTDFASVAMSVTVVLAIKRMAARKIKERKKKMQHLRKMTFLIIFTFLFCWSPYYASTLSLALSLHSNNNSKNIFPENSTEYQILLLKDCTQGNLYTWTLAIAALASIINPALYIFSREKIRLEFVKTFFSSRPNERTSSLKKCFTSCLVCWDTDENIKGKSKSKGSVFDIGWRNKTQKINPERSKVELEQVSKNARKSSLKCSNSEEVPRKETSRDVPMLRWNIDDHDINESREELYTCTEDVTPNLGLLLAPTQHRPRSLSARSVDIMSCSTTIASLAAEI